MDTLNTPVGADPRTIEGVWTHNLSVIETRGGPVLHMLRADSPLFRDFGEIYFSVVLPGAVKAWKKHTLQSQNFAVPSGLVQVVTYDDRPASPSFGKIESFLLGRPDYYRLLHLPPGVWYGFAGRSDNPAVLANCVDIPHSPSEAYLLESDSRDIPYSWG